jgi:LysR family hydrogen peroxide-inducible transcriptional activator
MLQTRFPDLRLELRETQTKQLVEDIKSGALDAAMLALPVGEPDIDALSLFEDLFLLAVPASDPRKESARVAAQDIDQSRLILLEDGHCLRANGSAHNASDNKLREAIHRPEEKDGLLRRVAPRQ